MRYRFFILFSCMFSLIFPVSAQQNPDKLLQVPQTDSTPSQKDTPARPREDLFAGMDSVSNRIVQALESLTSDLNKVNGVLKRGLDTIDIHEELPEVLNLLERLKGNLFTAEGSPNLRTLNSAKVLLVQNAAKLSDWQGTLEKYNSTLQGLRKEILQGLEVNEFSDTAVLHLYSVQLGDLDQKWRNVKTEFEVQNNNIALLLQRVAGASILTRDLMDEVNFQIRNVKRGMLHKTDPFIWEPFTTQEGDMATLFAKSTRFSWRMFVYYVSGRWSFILVLLLIAAGFYALVRKGLVYLGNQHQPALLEPVKYLSRNGVLCAALLAFTIIPFLSFSPPAVYIELSWFAMLLVASRLAWLDWSRAYHKYWRGIVLLFFLLGFDNLITRITPGERWFILCLSGAAVYLGVKLIQEVKREPLRYPSFQKEVVWLFILANTASFLLNVFGRFTLAKVISNSAVIGLAHALSFFLLVEIMVEALYLALEGNERKRLSVYFQFSALKIRFRKVLVFIGVCLWLLAFLWSLNLLDSTIEAISGILQKERLIGTMEFTLGSIAIFLLVFWCSFSISNLLRFLFRGNAGNQISSAGKNKMGSWILVVRLLIISVGFLLAMGAAGIPLDKLAIIIGALGVGIGFGLQNIVNNLVSGIILAFEKPMDVGDVIEIGPDTGRVKEIGIRSSKISTFDGADIIVPNGDFISQRLTNWTHNNTYRRIELLVGVAYGTDLDIAQQAVQKVLDEEAGIENQPSPSIFWHEMGNSAISMRILFWTNDFDNWVALKSRVLKAIYQHFNKAGISIPFPQQDLHLKTVSPEIMQQLTGFRAEE